MYEDKDKEHKTMADLYDEAAGSRAGGRGNYLRAGRYTLLCTKVHERDTRGQPRGGLSIISEWVVIASAPSGEREVTADGKSTTDRLIEPNPPGSSVSYVMSDKGNGAVMQPINFKSMVLGVLEGRGATEDKITPAVLRGVTSAKNPLRGHLVGCETTRIKAKESQKILDVPQWKGIAQTKEQVDAACAKLDARGKTVEQSSTVQQPAQPPKEMAKAPANLEIPKDPEPAPKADPAPDAGGGDNFLDMI